jgi:ABC-type Zn2+ transport system substrate-binding protein/surface adhesin
MSRLEFFHQVRRKRLDLKDAAALNDLDQQRYDCQNDENVDESTHRKGSHQPESPEHQQNNSNCVEHDLSSHVSTKSKRTAGLPSAWHPAEWLSTEPSSAAFADLRTSLLTFPRPTKWGEAGVADDWPKAG